MKMRKSIYRKYAYKKIIIATRIWSRMLLFVLMSTATNRGSGAEYSEKDFMKIGNIFHIFVPFDNFSSVTMELIPERDNPFENFHESTVNTLKLLESLINHQVLNNKKRYFMGNFYIDLCDNLQQLLEAYFKEFTFERLQQPWRAFTASWTTNDLANHLGINAAHVVGDYCYILVRLSRFRDITKLLRPDFLSHETDMVKVGDAESVLNFIRKYGSDYVYSFITGDSLYQVLVYNKNTYRHFKNRLNSYEISDISHAELSFFLSPWNAQCMGQIKATSGNRTVESWAKSKLRMKHFIFNYQSLFKIYGNSELLQTLSDLLQNEALLNIDMRTMASIFKDSAKQRWFEYFLDNYIGMWEVEL